MFDVYITQLLTRLEALIELLVSEQTTASTHIVSFKSIYRRSNSLTVLYILQTLKVSLLAIMIG